MGLLDWITEKAKAQYAKGEPYRQAASGLLQGDMNQVNQSLSKSDLTPTDFAMMLGTINPVRSVMPGLIKGAYSGVKPEGSAQQFKRTFKLKDGARISGTNTPDNSVLYGYDKNGEIFTVRPEYLTPDQFTSINEYKALFGE